MAEKKMKAPGVFKKPVKKEKWEKKYLKKIYLPEDRKFLRSLAVEEDGMIRVKVDGLSKKELKRLKVLGKTVRKNRKGVNFILILILILLAGGILYFNYFLKNSLVQRFLEARLEEIFEAQVDTGGVNLSIFRGEFSLDYLAVASSDNPMKNLVEFSSVKASLRTAELLQGRVYIEELGFAGMKRNTARTISGKLDEPAESAQPAEGTGKDDGSLPAAEGGADVVGDVMSQITAVAGGFDAKALLEQQKDKLVSFRTIEDAGVRVGEYAEQWKERSEDWSDRFVEWDSSVNYIRSIDAGSFSSIDSAQSTITRLQSVYDDAERDYIEIQNDYAEAERQFGEAETIAGDVRTAVETDYRYIESLVTLPAGDKVDWAASILEDQLSMPISKYLGYLDRGIEWYKRFKRFSDRREARKPESRRNSRSLPPPADAPPAFALIHAFASGEEPDISYRFDLNNLVSEPSKWDEAASLELVLDMPATGAASAYITEDALSLEVPAAPFDLGDSLSVLDIGSFSGRLAVVSDLGWNDEGFAGTIDLTAAELLVIESKPDSLIYRLINTSLESVKPLSAEGRFTFSDADGFSISLDTELDESLTDAAEVLIAEGAEEGLQLLRGYLDEQLAGPLADFGSSKDELGTYIDRIGSYESELQNYKSMADEKIKEIEQSVQDNIRKQAETIIKDNLPTDIVPEPEDALKSLGTKLKF